MTRYTSTCVTYHKTTLLHVVYFDFLIHFNTLIITHKIDFKPCSFKTNIRQYVLLLESSMF